MSDMEFSGVREPAQRLLNPAPAPTQVISRPWPIDKGDPELLPTPIHSAIPLRPPTPGRALARPLQPTSPAGPPSGFQRAMGIMRGVLPLAQKILPLLDGNIASVVSNILGPPPVAQASRVDLAPIEDTLKKMRMEQLELRGRIVEQNTSLKRVADQLEMVKEATDRNTLEQQELMEDLRKMRRKASVFAWVTLGLLAASLLINVVLLLRTAGLLR
ncbi:MAG: hypothetical protein WBM14_07845 [Terracidiphilus sp.]